MSIHLWYLADVVLLPLYPWQIASCERDSAGGCLFWHTGGTLSPHAGQIEMPESLKQPSFNESQERGG